MNAKLFALLMFLALVLGFVVICTIDAEAYSFPGPAAPDIPMVAQQGKTTEYNWVTEVSLTPLQKKLGEPIIIWSSEGLGTLIPTPTITKGRYRLTISTVPQATTVDKVRRPIVEVESGSQGPSVDDYTMILEGAFWGDKDKTFSVKVTSGQVVAFHAAVVVTAISID